MPSTVQLNTRIQPELKRAGDAVFARAGLSSSEVVRALWEHAARTQEVPAFILESQAGTGNQHHAIRRGAGLARTMAQALGINLSEEPPSFDVLRDEWYDEQLDGMYAQLA